MRKLLSCVLLLSLAALGACGRSVSIEKIAGDQLGFTGMSYYLPRGLVDLSISTKQERSGQGADADVSTIVTLTVGNVRYVPDPSHHYAISINHDIFQTDKIVVQVGRNGLLESISSDTKDESGEIIKRIARAPMEILGGGDVERKEGPAKYDKYDIKMTIDPTDPEDRVRLNTMLREVAPTIRFRARPLVRLPAMSSRTHAHPDCSVDPCFRVAMPYALELVSDPKNRILSPWDAERSEGPGPSIPAKAAGAGGNPSPDGGSTTTITRSGETAVTASAPALDGLVVARSVVLLPNKHVVGQVALTRALFVQKKFNLTFSDGLLTKADLDNPSEVLGFIQIPIEVAKAIVAIPSALFNFKVTQIQNDNKVLQAQKQNLEYQKQIIDAQKSLLLATQ